MKIQNQIAIYKSKTGNISLEVNFKKDSVWITQDQIALLFSTQRPAITKHLNNIFKSGELSKKTVSSILEHTAKDGKCKRSCVEIRDCILKHV